MINNLLLAFRDLDMLLLRNRSYNYPKPEKTQEITLFMLPQYFIALTLGRLECCSFISKSLSSIILQTLNELYELLHSCPALHTFFGTPQANGESQEP